MTIALPLVSSVRATWVAVPPRSNVSVPMSIGLNTLLTTGLPEPGRRNVILKSSSSRMYSSPLVLFPPMPARSGSDPA